jgi:hypothetical protein
MIRSSGLREGPRSFDLRISVCVYNFGILTARDRNFDEFKSGGLHEKHAVATWNLGTISAFAYKTEENQENLC